MRKEKLTASGLLFENAVQVVEDMLDYTIEQHRDAVYAEGTYAAMREKLAGLRRHLRGLLKKRWFKGPERERCLARAREVHQAELALGYLLAACRITGQLHSNFLRRAGRLAGMDELMSRFEITLEEKKRKQ